eukprot:gene19153-23464_t
MRIANRILLLGLLLYNMVGYSIAYLLEEKNSIGDAHYVERHPYSKDIVLKLPVDVPYQTNWDAPEPTEGKIEHEGEFYQMVSRQLINDTMYVHCEYDQNSRERFMDLVSNINDQVTGNTAESQKEAPSTVLKSFLKEYMMTQKKHVFYVFEWSCKEVAYPAPTNILLESHPSISSPTNILLESHP